MSFSFHEILAHVHMHFLTNGKVVTYRDLLHTGLPMKAEADLGDSSSTPWDLDYPWLILWLRYDDLPKPDNYSDLLIRINPTTPPGKPTEHGHVTIVFFCEGSVEKWVCFDKKLIHHYAPLIPAQKYGIFVDWDLSKKGPCPFPSPP